MRILDRFRSERGVTLTELAVTLALFGLIMVGVLATYQKSQEAYFVGSEVVETQQNVRTAVDFMVREIRSAGRDVNNCAFDYAGSGTLDCTDSKRDACRLKLNGSSSTSTPYNTCSSVFAIPYGTVLSTSVPSTSAIAIRADRNDNGRVTGVSAGPQDTLPSEAVLYKLVTDCTSLGFPGQCISRDEELNANPQAMVAVDISGLTFTYFPRRGYGPCGVSPYPDNGLPCPQFSSIASQTDADNIGMIRISVIAQQTTAGVTINRQLDTDVYLRNRN